MTHATIDAIARIQLLQQRLIDAVLPELAPAAAARVERVLVDQVMRSRVPLDPEADEQVAAWLAQTLRALDRRG